MTAEKLVQFAQQEYLNLETYRKDGKPVQTPVWFVEESGLLYCYTHASAGKVKRLRRNPRVRVVPCTFGGKPRGVWVEGTARIEEAEGTERGLELLTRKYGWKKRIGDFFSALRDPARVVFSIRLD